MGMLQKQAVLSLVQYSIQNLLCVKAKMHAPSPVSFTSFTIPTIIMLFNHFPGAALTRKFLHAVVLLKAEDCLAYRKEVMHMGFVEEMTEVLTLTFNDARELQRIAREYRRKKLTREQFIAAVEEISLKMEQRVSDCLSVEQKRTERCQVCDRTYPASEIVTREGEQLCQQCDLDKYPIRDEDIPF